MRGQGALGLITGLLVTSFALSQASGVHGPIPGLGIEAPPNPQFPAAYEVEYLFSVPYVEVVQTQRFQTPVHVWYDAEQQALRQDVYGGLDTVLTLEGVQYIIFPRIDKKVCEVKRDVGPSSSATTHSSNAEIPPPLPDFSTWAFSGTTKLRNSKAYVWTNTYPADEKVNSYTLYSTPEGIPLRLQMIGYNIMSPSHYDEYLVDFLKYKPGRVDPSVFAAPDICDGAMQQFSALPQHLALSAQMSLLLPFRKSDMQDSTPRGERLTLLQGHKALISSWNAQQRPAFRVALNRFAHWQPQEFSALMTGFRPRDPALQNEVQEGDLGTYERVLSDEALPVDVDWRGTGADWLVKDQCTCGSCWAFATTGVVQSAWFLATGQITSLSEQQLLDCSWEHGNHGCGGGNMEPAIAYLSKHGGALLAEDYPYIGQNNYCGANGTLASAASLKGWQRVKARDEKALMEAVYLRGPVAVSMDASPDLFKFYSEGVFEFPQCKWKAGELDHAVLVVGYGTDKEGRDFWLVRNSWSAFWGEDGYVRVSRKFDCGITTDPVMAVVEAPTPPPPAVLAAKAAAVRRAGPQAAASR